MKLVTYKGVAAGTSRLGVLVDDDRAILDVRAAERRATGHDNPAFATMQALIEAGPEALDRVRALAADPSHADCVPAEERGQLLAPLPRPMQLRKPLDLDYCLTPSERNPIIAAPLKVTDCSPISDGAAAVVITRRDRTSDFAQAVAFRAAEQVNDLLPLSAKDLAAFEGPNRAFAQAYAAAGITVDDVSFAEVHDCFTIAELLSVEAMGLAAPGQGMAVIGEGQTAASGRLPVNRSGGLKAKGHPVGATGVSMHVLAARQLTGRADAMQLPAPQLGVCFNMGGGAVVSCVSVLEPIKV